MRYLELLEKNYVIFSHHGFSRNLRKEYTKSPRYYFWDNGGFNSLISNYNRLNLRDDVGRPGFLNNFSNNHPPKTKQF